MKVSLTLGSPFSSHSLASQVLLAHLLAHLQSQVPGIERKLLSVSISLCCGSVMHVVVWAPAGDTVRRGLDHGVLTTHSSLYLR